MAYPFRNLVLESGGVKGIAYVGALAILEEKGILPQITRVGETSAGAINAVLLGVGYTRAEMLQLLLEPASAVCDTILDTQSSQHLHSDDRQRTVYIDTLGVRPTDFDVDSETNFQLVESGLTHTKGYFDWHDDPKNAPVNRPG